MGYITDDLDMEDFLTYEGLDFRHSHGNQGVQLNVRECPVCEDDRWKVYVNAETGLGNCFKCDASFSKWSFIKALLKTEDNREVGKFISDTLKAFGYQPKRQPREKKEIEQPKLILPSSMPLPTTDGRNAQYLEDRGVSGHYAKLFGLRLSLIGSFRFRSDEGELVTQNFKDRIIIPVRDLDGELVTFQGRDFTGKAETKYLFPAKLPGTARFLYNGHRALGLRAREVLLGEGAFDVIAQQIAADSFEEMNKVVPVGSFGKSLSDSVSGPSQLDAFRRLRNEGGLETVTVMWDGEKAALSSALRAAQMLVSIGLKVRIALLPIGKDPAEVEASEVFRAWREALEYSRTLETRLKIQSPYS